MRNFILLLAFSAAAFGQCGANGKLIKNPLTGLWDCTGSSSGGGTPAGSDTQIQYNNAGAFGASSGFTFNSGTGTFSVGTSFSIDGTAGVAATAKFPWTVNALVKGGGAGVAPIITGCTVDASDNLSCPGTISSGAAATTGQVLLSGATSGTVTIQPQAVAGVYNFNLPISAGTSGFPLLSGGGGATAMSFARVGLAAGGTNADLSATGGTSQFLKQASAGAAVTVVRPACADLSDASAACSSLTGLTLVTPILGTPQSGTLTNATGLPAAGVVGTAAVLGANTFTGLQTITQASANAKVLASTGYSLTGSDATAMVDLAGTWNTSGTPTAFQLNITNTGSNANSRLMDIQANGTSVFLIRATGPAIFAGEIRGPDLNMTGGLVISPQNTAAEMHIANTASGCGTASFCRDLKLRHSINSGAAPTLSVGTGTITGADGAGRVTLTAGSQTTITVTFGTAYTVKPVCTAVDETTAANNPILPGPGTGTVSFAATGTYGAADVIAYHCEGY